jgi:copper chaperone CopZ
MIHTLAIAGMSCDHCVRRVTKALGAVPGVTVKDVHVGRARIETSDPGVLARAIEALGAAGYPAEASS